MINLFKPQGAANGVYKDQRLQKLHEIKPGRQMQYANGLPKQIVQYGNMHHWRNTHTHKKNEEEETNCTESLLYPMAGEPKCVQLLTAALKSFKFFPL